MLTRTLLYLENRLLVRICTCWEDNNALRRLSTEPRLSILITIIQVFFHYFFFNSYFWVLSLNYCRLLFIVIFRFVYISKFLSFIYCYNISREYRSFVYYCILIYLTAYQNSPNNMAFFKIPYFNALSTLN